MRVALVAGLTVACSRTDAPATPPTSATPPAPARDAGAGAAQVTGSVAHPFDAGAAPDPKNDPHGFVVVPYDVKCPSVGPPVHDATLLAATGAEAGLLVSPEGFLRSDIGAPEAVALLGEPVLCSHEESSSWSTWYLFPHAVTAHPLDFELDDDQLAGIALRLTQPVAVDMVALTKRFGTPKPWPAPLDSGLPEGYRFDITTDAYSARLAFSHRDAADPPTAWQVDQILFRRTPKADILPESFRTEADVQRLIALALRPRPPAPVEFFGTVGVFVGKVGDRLTFTQRGLDRNIAEATMEKQTIGKRDYLHSLSVTFAQPIAVSSLAASPNVAPTIVDGKLTALTIARAPL